MTPLLANIIWPALILMDRLMSEWAIGTGLALEYLVVRKLTNLPSGRAILATLAANAVSTLVGTVILLPLAGFVWEVFPGEPLNYYLKLPGENPISFVASCLMGAAINAWIEGWVLRKKFGALGGRRQFWVLFGANFVTVALAYASVLYHAPKL